MLVPVLKFTVRLDDFTDSARTEVAHEMHILAMRNARSDDDDSSAITVGGPTGEVIEREPIEEYRRFQRRYGRNVVLDNYGRFSEGRFTQMMENHAKEFWPEGKDPETGEDIVEESTQEKPKPKPKPKQAAEAA